MFLFMPELYLCILYVRLCYYLTEIEIAASGKELQKLQKIGKIKWKRKSFTNSGLP